MGKHEQARKTEQLRQLREAERQAELEKQKQQNRLMWMIVAGFLAVVLLASGITVLVSFLTSEPPAPGVPMDDLDLTDKDISHFTDTDQVTDYVKLNVTYTDQDGTEHTGDIIIQLYSEVAPITVENFQNLVSKKFYDGLTFHRIINNRMIQGGDPLGNGYGGNTDENGNRINITGEFSENGITNNLSHIRGVVSMARSDPYDSASSQFFIVHQTNAATAAWDGSYAAFGYVVYGIEHVDGIAAVRTNSSDAPINPVTINTASFVEYNG